MEIDGRGLCPAVGVDRLMMMMMTTMTKRNLARVLREASEAAKSGLNIRLYARAYIARNAQNHV